MVSRIGCAKPVTHTGGKVAVGLGLAVGGARVAVGGGSGVSLGTNVSVGGSVLVGRGAVAVKGAVGVTVVLPSSGLHLPSSGELLVRPLPTPPPPGASWRSA